MTYSAALGIEYVCNCHSCNPRPGCECHDCTDTHIETTMHSIGNMLEIDNFRLVRVLCRRLAYLLVIRRTKGYYENSL